MSNKKKNKEKVRYIDDGRTIVDMTPLGSSGSLPRLQRSTLKEQAKTYFSAVKMMLLPMFIVIAAICIIFGVLWLVFTFAPA